MPVRDLLSAASTQGAAPADPYFYDVSLLLNGDGTNGAQNNTFLDSSTNNFTITRNGNTTQGSFSPYGSNWGSYFDGDGDNLSLNGTAVGTSDATVDFFIFPTDSSATYRAVFDNRSTPGTNTGFGIFQYGLTIELYGNGLKASSAANALNINQWNHVALTRSSGTCQIYINGVASGSSGSYSDNLTSTVVKIGDTAPGSSLPYIGYISNLRLVIGSVLYTGSYTVPTTPLTAISGTNLLTCQSNRFIDNSSNAFAITPSGTPSVQRFSPFNPTAPYDTSVIGGSGYFDGSGDYLLAATGSSGAPGTGDFCAEAFFYRTPASSDNNIMTNTVNSGDGDTAWGIGASGIGNVVYFTTWNTTLLSATVPPVNTWNHLAVCRSGTTLSMFLNGTRVATTTNSMNFSSTNNIRIGAYASGFQPYNGYISNARFVKGSSVYNPSSTTITVPTAPLTAITNTSLLTNFTNAGIPDLAMQNNLETVGNAQVSTSVKKYGTGSLAFDGAGDYLSTSNVAFAFGATANYTVEGWAYRSASTDDVGIVATRGATVGFSIFFYGGVLNFQQSADTGTADNVTETAPPINQWFHFAAVRNNGVLRLYINGVSTNTATSTKNLVSTSLVIGKELNNYATYYWPGYIDDLRISKVCRYTANFTPPTSALPTY